MISKILLPEIELLIKEKKFKALKDVLFELNEQDIVDMLCELSASNRAFVFRLLPKDLAADVFGEMEQDHRENLLKAFHEKEIINLLNDMPPDERTDLFEEMPASFVRRYIPKLIPEERAFSLGILNYPSDSVARLVTDEYLTLGKDMTVKEAISCIRTTSADKETIYYCYVIDKTLTLIGVISLKEILISPDDKHIEDLMKKNVISIRASADQEKAVELFKKYDFLALPVVDKEQRIIGIITFDDIMDVEEEETTEDIHRMSAVTSEGENYFQLNPFQRVWKRLPWLFALLLMATFDGKILNLYQNSLEKIVALAFFVPILLGAGGNAGSQSLAVVVRGLATGEIEVSNIFRILGKEIFIGIVMGLVLGLFGFLQAYTITSNQPGFILIAFTVSMALISTIVIGTTIGTFLPLFFKKIGFDPAVMSGPFIQTTVDVLGLVVYLEIARHILRI